MPDYIGELLPTRIIRVTKGADRSFTITRRDDDGDPADWNAALYIDIDIDKTAPMRVPATVVGETATIRIESTICDQVRNGTSWRVIMSQAGSPTFETALMIGTFERNDK